MTSTVERAYAILGLEPGASLDDVKQAFRDLAKVWHPDRFAHDERLRTRAEATFKQINAAYQQLQLTAPPVPPAVKPAAPPRPAASPAPKVTVRAARHRARHARMALPGAEVFLAGRRASLVNLSLTGALLHVDIAPTPHAVVPLVFDVGSERLQLHARVVRVARRDMSSAVDDRTPAWTTSVTFVNVTPEAQRAIPRFYNLLRDTGRKATV